MFNFDSNEDEQTTPKRSREPTSPEEAIDGAHKKQRVQKAPQLSPMSWARCSTK